MFWERFYNLCLEYGTKPNRIRELLGVSSGTISNWKAGRLPGRKTLERIGEHFHVTVGYLLGYVEQREAQAEPQGPATPPATEQAQPPTPEEAAQLTGAFLVMPPEDRAKVLEYAAMLVARHNETAAHSTCEQP
jgi:transcriptional regulator with XRE-family HTH domain